MEDLKISICIPTWEQHGVGRKFLEHLLKTIDKQSYKNYEVVISDHSLDSEIQNFVKNKENIKYFRNKEKRGNSPFNTNNAIVNASGDVIKIMFQDDFFFNSNALSIISESFKDRSCEWLVNGCNHTAKGRKFYRPIIPLWNSDIPLGNNTIGCPSVLSFRRTNNLFFDENLVMLMDCEYYHQLYKTFGAPCIVQDILTTVRVHSKQISSLYDKDLKEEIKYVKLKHGL